MRSDELAGPPPGPAPVPAVVTRLADGDDVTPVWRNELGGLTFRLEKPDGGRRYVKWSPPGVRELDLAAEAERLAWAGRWARVPRVLEVGADSAGAWLVTAAVPGRSAVEPRWSRDPHTAARAIGHGLRRLHDALPVVDCPYEWSVGKRLERAHERIADDESFDRRFPEHRHLSAAEVQARLDRIPPVDRLVVCHGDACAPNTLLHDDGTFAAHVDLGSLGVADRWADLATAAWSVDWNYGPGYDHLVYAAYGVEPDPVRIAYYRLLWDLG